MRKIYTALCFLFFVGSAATAQVNRYQFTQTTGTYSAINSGTVHATGWDDAVANTTIPFTFTFNGTGYTTASVNTNGYITFGGTTSAGTDYTPISAGTAYSSCISAFGRDLISNGAKILAKVSGSTPNRIYIIQWENAQRYSGGSITGDVLNFQIRLFETTNVIEVMYGTCTAASITTLTAQVGLRGAANSDYSNRTMNNSSWATTDLGQSNAATLNSLNTILPASGLIFRWTPASCAIPTSISMGTVTATTAVINWAAASPAPASGYNWKVVSQSSGSEATGLFTGSVGAGVITATASGLTQNTSYAVYVRSNCSPTNSSWNGPVNFTTVSTTPTITLSPTTLSVTGYNQGAGPVSPATSSFSASAINLSANLLLTAPADYEISTASASGFGNIVSLVPSSGTVSATRLYVRYIAGLSANNYNSEILNATSAGAVTKTVSLSGAIYQPNNDCSGATSVTVNASGCTIVSASSLYATQSTAGCTGNADDDVWFSFTAVATGQFIFVTPGTMVDPVIEVFYGTCGSLVSLNCANNTSTGDESGSLTGLTIGSVYYVRVHSNGSSANAGTFDLRICTYPAPACTSNLTPATGSTTALSTSGQATLTWNATANAINYAVYLGTTNPPTTLITTVAATTATVSVAAGTLYYWYVQPIGSTTGASCGSTATSFTGACLNASFGQYPSTAYTPACSGSDETITTIGYCGEYSVVNVTSGMTYRFSSSTATDFVTISNTTPSIVYATGIGRATWTATFTGSVRFYTHTTTSCGESSISRTRSVSCVFPPAITSFTPASGCAGTQSITITGTNLTGATSVTIGGTPISSIVSNTATQIVVTAGNGTTGTITVVTAGGTATSAGTFTVLPAPSVNAIGGGAASVCVGSSTPSFTNATAGGTWSVTAGTGTASITAGGILTGTAAGTITVVYTVTSGGCSTTASAAVIVYALPSAPVITPASATVCENSIQSLTVTAAGSGTLFSENFEGGTLGGFTLTTEPTHNSGTITQWVNQSSPHVPPVGIWSESINSGSRFALSNSDAGAVPQTTNNSIVSPLINTTGYTALSLSFRHYYHYYNGPESGYVEVSVNGGTSWTTVQTYPSEQGTAASFVSATINLNAYINNANFKFRFRYYSTWDWGWAIDDVVLTATGTNSVTWSPVTNLFTDAAATVAYTGLSAFTVYAKPAATVTYTATATNSGSCINSANVTVTVTPQPNAVISYTGSPYCASGTASVTMGGTAGTATGTFSSSAGLSINSGTGLINLTASTPATYTVNYSVAASGGCLVYNTTTSVTINSGSGWAGLNTNWFDPANWCSGVPTATSDVVIPSGVSNYPIITTGTALSKNISIAAGASVMVNGTGIYSLYGTVTNAGTFSLVNGTLNLAGAGVSVGGSSFASATLKNLTISNTSSITAGASNMLKVSGDVSFLTSGNTFTTNGNLTLLSGASATASLKDITTNGTLSGNSVTGNVSVQRYIPAGRKWRFLAMNTLSGTGSTNTINANWMEGQAAGVSISTGYGLWITGAGGLASNFDATTATPSVKYWDDVTQAYVSITNPLTDNIRTRTAYMAYVRGDRSATGTGPGAAVLTPTVLRTYGVLTQGTGANITVAAGSGYKAIGNPYASAADLTKLIYSDGGAATINIAVWDPQLSGVYGLGGFQTLTKASADANFAINPGGGSYGSIGSAMNAIESGQAFFIQGSTAARDIAFRETAKTPKAHDVFFTAGAEQKLYGRMYIRENDGTLTLMDGITVRYKDEYQTAADPDDARKLLNTNENVSVKRGQELLAVEYRDMPGNDDTLKINISSLRVKDYQWKFDLVNMDAPGRTGILVDRFLNTETLLNLNSNNIADFSVTNAAGSYAADRFCIVFTQSVVPPAYTVLAAWRFRDDAIQVKWHTDHEQQTARYESEHSKDSTSFTFLAAQNALNNSGGNIDYGYTDIHALRGDNYYRVKIIGTNGEVKYSNTVRVEGLKGTPMIAVIPNPVADKTIHLEMSGLLPAIYNAKLENSIGQVITSLKIAVREGWQTENIPLKKTTAPGSYQLRISTQGQNIVTIPVIIN